jgi:ketosteroid isomerase-like protein
MAAHPNVDVIQKAYDAFGAGDMATLAEYMDGATVWHSPGSGHFARDYKDRDATFAYFGELFERSGGTFKATLHTILADDDHAIGLHRNTASREGKTLDENIVIVFHMRKGKIVEAWEQHYDTNVWDEFWK